MPRAAPALALLAAAGALQAAPRTRLEPLLPPPRGLEVERTGGVLRCRGLEEAPDGTRWLAFAVPEGVDVTRCEALVAKLRTRPGDPLPRLRWLALDGRRAVRFQRPVRWEGGEAWDRRVWPLRRWRWGSERAGEWSQVRAFALFLESPGVVSIDGLHLVGPGSEPRALLAPAALEALAFGEGPVWTSEGEGLRVGCALEPPPPGDERDALLARAAPIPRWLDRLAGREAPAGRPVSLLVFADGARRAAFLGRLGELWRVRIGPPEAAGYTLQDVALLVHEPARGLDRPAALHEVVHAHVARRLGLVAGQPAHDWLQEGLANYLQLCLFPEAIDAGAYPRAFARGLGGRPFRPLAELVGADVPVRDYAQIASVIAFLDLERPEWLRALLAGVPQGGSAEAVLGEVGADLATLEREWLAWGRRVFDRDAAPPGRPFPLPPEWR